MTRIFVPQDVAALAVGANKVAAKIAAEAQARGLPIEIIRTGSRGMFFLEPLIEVETAQGRIGYGPVSAADVASLFDAGLLAGGAHALRIGKPEDPSVPCAADAAHLRPLRHHRSALAGRL